MPHKFIKMQNNDVKSSYNMDKEGLVRAMKAFVEEDVQNRSTCDKCHKQSASGRRKINQVWITIIIDIRQSVRSSLSCTKCL